MGAVGNVDTMYFQVEAENFHEVLGGLQRELQQVCEHRFFTKDRRPVFFSLGGLELEFTNGRYSWSYGLKCEDFHLFLLACDSELNNVMPMYVEFSQAFLWLYGYQKAYARFMAWLETDLGLHNLTTKISRADICVHTDEPILQESYLKNLYYDPRCEVATITTTEFTAADLDKINGGRVDIFKRAKEGYTGIRVGKGQPLMARIYDKSLEIKHSKKEWFRDIWQNIGLDPEHIINVEYEIKREWFNQRSIHTVEEFMEQVGDIWLFLTKNYLAFRNLDNSRRSRRSFCSWWEALRQEPFTYHGSVIARRKVRQINVEKALDGVLGYAVSYAAGIEADHLDRGVFDKLYRASIDRDLQHRKQDKPTFQERIKQKRAKGFTDLADQENIFLDEYKEVFKNSYESDRNPQQRAYLCNW